MRVVCIYRERERECVCVYVCVCEKERDEPQPKHDTLPHRKLQRTGAGMRKRARVTPRFSPAVDSGRAGDADDDDGGTPHGLSARGRELLLALAACIVNPDVVDEDDHDKRHADVVRRAVQAPHCPPHGEGPRVQPPVFYKADQKAHVSHLVDCQASLAVYGRGERVLGSIAVMGVCARHFALW